MVLTGQRFGRLEVLSEDEDNKYSVICRCDCGNVKSVKKYCLTSGNTRSCGCMRKETAKKNMGNLMENSHFLGTNFSVIASNKVGRNNRTGHKGVWYNNKRGVYEAYISVKKKRIRLGVFLKYDDAVKAREDAEERFFMPLIEERNRMEVFS